MDRHDAIARRFPEHAFTLRQLDRRDPEFRALCEDYGEAQRALEHWQRVGGSMHARVAEYREITDALADQIQVALERWGRDRGLGSHHPE